MRSGTGVRASAAITRGCGSRSPRRRSAHSARRVESANDAQVSERGAAQFGRVARIRAGTGFGALQQFTRHGRMTDALPAGREETGDLGEQVVHVGSAEAALFD